MLNQLPVVVGDGLLFARSRVGQVDARLLEGAHAACRSADRASGSGIHPVSATFDREGHRLYCRVPEGYVRHARTKREGQSREVVLSSFRVDDRHGFVRRGRGKPALTDDLLEDALVVDDVPTKVVHRGGRYAVVAVLSRDSGLTEQLFDHVAKHVHRLELSRSDQTAREGPTCFPPEHCSEFKSLISEQEDLVIPLHVRGLAELQHFLRRLRKIQERITHALRGDVASVKTGCNKVHGAYVEAYAEVAH